MAVERWCLNPVDEPTGDATLPSPLELAAEDGTTGIHLAGVEYPPLASEALRAQSISTEGAIWAARKLDTKNLTLNLIVIEPDGADDTAAATNLVRDPGGEGDASRWAVEELWTNELDLAKRAAVTQVTDAATAFKGDRYVKVVTNTSFSDSGVEGTLDPDPTTGVFQQTPYRFDVWLRGNAGGESVTLSLGLDGGGITDVATSAVVLTTSWARYSVTWTPVFNRDSAHFSIVKLASGGSPITFFVDAAMVTRGSTALPYFDGDYPGCEWAGAPRASRSRRIASGSRRYRIAGDLEQAVEYVSSRGQGTLRRNTPGGQQVTFDLIDANITWDSQQFIDCGVATAKIDFTCQPFGKGVEVTATEITNLILNPSAETDVTLWTATNNTLSRTTGQNAVGAAAFQLSSTAGGDMNIAVTTNITVTPGKMYHASAWFKSAVSVRACNVVFQWFDAIGGSLVSTTNGTTANDATTGWTIASLSGAAPYNAGAVKVFLVVAATGGAAEIHYIDGAILHDGDTLVSFFDGTFPNAYWTGTANLSASVKLGTVCNLITNPTFEALTATPRAGWSETDADATMTVSNSSTVTHGKSRQSMKLVNTAGGAGDDDYMGFTLAASIVKPFTVYTVAAWVRVESFVAGALGSRGLYLVDDAIGNVSIDTITGDSGGWIRLWSQITTPTEPTTISVRLYGPQATTYWDEVILVEGTTVPDYFDGDTPGYSWCGLPHESESMGPNAVVQKTLPVGILTADVKGNADAQGKLTVTDVQGADQNWVIWGKDSKNIAVSNPLQHSYYGAEIMTVLGGSSIGAGPTGTLGTALLNGGLIPTYVAILSTTLGILSGTPNLEHVGPYRVFARVQAPAANTGTVTVAMEWSEGDFLRFTRNDDVEVNPFWGGTWRLVDLGQINIPRATRGAQRWIGRLLAKSTATNDDIYVDGIFLVPTAEGSGEVGTAGQLATPTAFLARDEFGQIAGVLTGKALPSGGTWVFLTGDVDDFNVTGSGTVIRTAVSDSAPRLMAADTSTPTTVAAKVTVYIQ